MEVTPEVKKDTVDVFFRIHFSKNDEILEELLPKLRKFNFNGPLPGRVRSQLDDSGPCIVLLNKILEQPNKHKPTVEVQNRADFLWNLYSILLNAREVIAKELEFKSIMSALIAYHQKKTTYPQVLKVIMDVTMDLKLTKDFMVFLTDKALHYSMPYQARDSSSDEEFMFDELSDGEGAIQTRVRREETIGDIIANVESDNGEKGQWALHLFLDGAMNRDDLQLFCPSTENSKLEADPVAIGSHDFVTQLLKKDEVPKNQWYTGRVPESYLVVADKHVHEQTTGASIFEEFVETRKYRSTCIMRNLEDPAKKHPNVDAEQSLNYVVGACEILHDQEIDSDILYNATLDVQNNKLGQGLLQPLSEIYGIQSDDVIDFLKSANCSCPAVCESMKQALVRYAVNYYRSMNGAYVRLTQEAVRWFPHPEILPEAIDYLRLTVSAEIVTRIVDLVMGYMTKIDNVFEMKYLDILYITKFSKYYKLYLRKFHPLLFIEPPAELVDSSIDWCVIYEKFITDVIKNHGVEAGDLPEVRYLTPVLDELLKKAANDLTSQIYPITDESVLPVKLVKFTMKSAGGAADILALEIVGNKE